MSPPMAEPVPFPQPEAPRQHELLSGDTMLKTFAYAKQQALACGSGSTLRIDGPTTLMASSFIESIWLMSTKLGAAGSCLGVRRR